MRCLLPLAAAAGAAARVVDIEKDGGAIAGAVSNDQTWANGAVVNATLANLTAGDVWVVPNKTFYIMGGIKVDGLQDVTIQIDGTLRYAFSDTLLGAEKYIKDWPRPNGKDVSECMYFNNLVNVTFTSSGHGTLDGAGPKWWGIPGIGYLVRQENRPRLITIDHSKKILFENILLKDSPYWTFWAPNVDGLEVRYSQIDARRMDDDGHSIIDQTAFNTDGFDVTGRNVWIHDCSVWNDDDCIAVKDGSENMLFERINASGVGLTIGSIGGSTNRNITFRDCYMHHTTKGIYMKFRGGGSVSDVTYENIVMDAPQQFAIWIGPAQQSDSNNLCAAHPCSICWPILPGAKCPGADGQYTNITLRNITVLNPKQSPGVILALNKSAMKNVVFDNVVVSNPPTKPFPDYYTCDGVESGVATGSTYPVPPCFKDLTNH